MWLLRAIGTLMEYIKGPGTTTVSDGEEVHRTVKVTFNASQIVFEITSKRIVYKTAFRTRWYPAMRRAIFEVEGRVISGDMSLVSPRLLERVIYPNLSSRGLLHTEYPHVRAIGAYLDRLHLDGVSSVVLA